MDPSANAPFPSAQLAQLGRGLVVPDEDFRNVGSGVGQLDVIDGLEGGESSDRSHCNEKGEEEGDDGHNSSFHEKWAAFYRHPHG